MRFDDFSDKENGTTRGLQHSGMSDDERNVMADLAHEACDWHCAWCETCSPVAVGPNNYVARDKYPMDGETFCEDCIAAAYHAALSGLPS